MAARRRNKVTSWETEAAERTQPQICAVSGKRVYTTESEAKATAAHRMASSSSSPAQLRTYRCQYCNGWHLTSKQA